MRDLISEAAVDRLGTGSQGALPIFSSRTDNFRNRACACSQRISLVAYSESISAPVASATLI